MSDPESEVTGGAAPDCKEALTDDDGRSCAALSPDRARWCHRCLLADLQAITRERDYLRECVAGQAQRITDVQREREAWQERHRLQGEAHLRETRQLLHELEAADARLRSVDQGLLILEQQMRAEIARVRQSNRVGPMRVSEAQAWADQLATLRAKLSDSSTQESV